MNFFKSLLTADGEISSKRFAGLVLIGMFIVTTIIEAITGNVSDTAHSLMKTGLYGGLGLLGVNGVETMFKR